MARSRPQQFQIRATAAEKKIFAAAADKAAGAKGKHASTWARQILLHAAAKIGIRVPASAMKTKKKAR